MTTILNSDDEIDASFVRLSLQPPPPPPRSSAAGATKERIIDAVGGVLAAKVSLREAIPNKLEVLYAVFLGLSSRGGYSKYLFQGKNQRWI